MHNQLKRVYRRDTQEHTSVEEQLYDIKHKTVPQHESSTWRNPLNNQQPWYQKQPKHYTEVEHIQHQCIYREAYEKSKHDKRLSFMQDSLEVLKKIMEQENPSTPTATSGKNKGD